MIMRFPSIPQYRQLPELQTIEDLINSANRLARCKVEARIAHESKEFPIYSIALGPDDPTTPVFAVFAGVHGLERVGTHVANAFLESVLQLLTWDEHFQNALERTRLLFVPLINPVGMSLMRRSNGNGIDLMRNAPIDADEKVTLPLVGGQRFSPRLPWYRGSKDAPMEMEAQTICNFVERELFHASVAISVDIHSGFGRIDRLWFPYARSRKPFHHLAEIMAFKELLDRTYPNHVYQVEPQSQQYTTHGDLWDYLYEKHHQQADPTRIFLPLSLEMGSWMWVKKNPRQIFNVLGAFNPFIEHRFKRVLRRHILLLDFMFRAAGSHQAWRPSEPLRTEELRSKAKLLWWPATKN